MTHAGVVAARNSRSVTALSHNMQKGIYRHFKGGKYEVLDTVKHSETLEEMVLYRHLDDDGGLWVRPKAMFEETIERDGKIMPRFTYEGASH